MLFSTIVLTLPLLTQAATLLEALKQSGASDFATQISSDSELSAIFLSPNSSVQTVFAPLDASISYRKRDDVDDKRKAKESGVTGYNRVGDVSQTGGLVMGTSDDGGNLGGDSQKVVSNPNPPPQNGTGLVRRDGTVSLVRIFSGLGNNVSIIKGDIPYDGGVLHIIDDYFTVPTSLSSTAKTNGHTSFGALSNSTNLTSTIDNTPSITCFIPSNAAFAQRNATSQYNSSTSLLTGHIIPNFVGYLPSLKDGVSYKSQDGSILTITIKGNDYFVNNAKIISANQILANGVAHVIDQIVQPKSAPAPFKGAAATTMGSGILGVWSLVLGLLAATASFLV